MRVRSRSASQVALPALFALLALAPSAAAQGLDQLLERHAASRGDAEAWAAVAAIEVRGTLGANGRENEVRLVRDRAGRARLERRFRDLTRVFVDDGERAFLRDWGAGAFAPLDPPAREQWLQDVDLLLSFPRSFDRYARIEDAGVVAADDGRELRKLVLTPPAGLPLQLTLDPTTGQAERGRYLYVDPEDGNTYAMELMVIEQLEVATSHGVLRIPGYQEREEGTSLTTWIPERVEVLDEVDGALFRP